MASDAIETTNLNCGHVSKRAPISKRIGYSNPTKKGKCLLVIVNLDGLVWVSL